MKKIICFLVILFLCGCVKEAENPDFLLSQAEISIEIGESASLNATITGTLENELLWLSNDTSIATVDQSGNIVGVSAGKTTVVVKMVKFNKSKYITVTVLSKSDEVTPISFGEISIELEKNAKQTIIPVINGLEQYELNWFSAKPNVATVSQTGEITGIAVGSTSVTATIVGTVYYATITVVVIPVSSNVSIKFSYTGYNMEIGSEVTALPTVLGITDYSLIWSSSDESVATVTSDGVITALAEGAATITATIENLFIFSNLNIFVISEGGSSEVTLTFNQSVYNIFINEEITLQPIVTGMDKYSLIWATNNEAILSVSELGEVKGISVGTTTILVLIDGTSVTALVTINVFQESVDEPSDVVVSFEDISINIDLGESLTLAAIVQGITEYQLVWLSNNNQIVEVNQGVITGLSAGRAVVVVSIEGFETAASIIINVIGTYTHISFTKIGYNIEIGEELLVAPDVVGLDEYQLVWSSNKTSVATVSNGLIVGISEGIAIVSVYIVDTDKVAALVIKVLPAAEITVSFVESGLNMDVSNTFTPTVSVVGIAEYDLIWESNDNSVATVDQNGLITAIGVGLTEIVVRVSGTAKTATLEITVYDSNTIVDATIIFDRSRYDLIIGDSLTLVPTVLNIESYVLTWASSDISVATINEFGLLVAVSEGETQITVTIFGTEITASLNVVVSLPIKIEISYTFDGCADNTMQLVSNVIPASFNQSVTWTANANSIATVTSDGLVVILASGSVTFTATSIEDNTIVEHITIAFIYIPEDGVIFNEIEIEV